MWLELHQLLEVWGADAGLQLQSFTFLFCLMLAVLRATATDISLWQVDKSRAKKLDVNNTVILVHMISTLFGTDCLFWRC